MAAAITIIRYPYEEPYHIHLVIIATNGPLQGRLEFYTDPSEILALADIFAVFPRHAEDVYLWELGSERREDRFAFYLRIRLFTVDSAGHCAIQLRFNNNKDLPQCEISEFCITSEPSDLNRLGLLLREFAKLDQEVLHWTGNNGRLFKTQEQARIEGYIVDCT